MSVEWLHECAQHTGQCISLKQRETGLWVRFQFPLVQLMHII